jgi:hypothetical protein
MDDDGSTTVEDGAIIDESWAIAEEDASWARALEAIRASAVVSRSRFMVVSP